MPRSPPPSQTGSASDGAATTDAQNFPPDPPVDLPLPRHVAIICDGNARWARRRGLPEAAGHAAGATRVVQLIRALQRQDQCPSLSQQQPQRAEMGQPPEHTRNSKMEYGNHDQSRQSQRIEFCTLFAFSTENWSRPTHEIRALFDVVEQLTIRYQTDPAVQEGRIRIRLLGDLDDERMPGGARRELRTLERLSEEACGRKAEDNLDDNGDDNRSGGKQTLTICLAINYGGRADILQAARRLARDLVADPDAAADADAIARRLQTRGLPDPDLIVRTGGERRLSNFLLWEAAYAELYFADAPWPDFDGRALEAAVGWYGTRRRRFGGRRSGEG